MVAKKGSGTSIIDIIQEMVKKGEPEEKIVQALKDLGVEAEEAKKLLLLGEANTFALLAAEINRMVDASLKERFSKFVADNEKKAKEQIERTMSDKEKEFEGFLSKKQSEMESQIKQLGGKAVEIVEKTRQRTEQLGQEQEQMKLDIEQIRVSGKKPWWISKILVVGGTVFALLLAFLIWKGIGNPISIDETIRLLVLGIVSITMFFIAAII
jgi:hypothetical protein